MKTESMKYLWELVSERISDLRCQVEDGVEGSSDELKIALEAQDELW